MKIGTWNWKKTVRGLTALALALGIAVGGSMIPARAVTQADIDALKGDAKEIAQDKRDLQAKIDQLSSDISNNLRRKELLDQQISLTEDEITNKEEEIAVYGQMITQSEAELADAEAREAAQYELFCKRVREMEKHGKVDYWSVLFRADSFSDLLSRLDIVNEIMKYDQKVMQDWRDVQEEVKAKKATLEGQKAESEAAKAELESKKTELDKQREAANQVIAQLRAQKSEQEDAMDDLDDDAEAIQAKILKLSRQLAAEEEARRAAEAAARGDSGTGSSTQSNPGGYIWPVNSRYITSAMGMRYGGIGAGNHKGNDIGRVGYTSSIYAAKSGTVIVSEYHKSYGNYVVVSHGSGNTTLYAHMSKRLVSVGQHVNQGDVLGITGSTGNSTGPHLHFEVTENGSRIDPFKLGYLTGAVYAK